MNFRNIFLRRKDKKQLLYDEAVLIEVHMNGQRNLDQLHALESELATSLPEGSHVDGNEVGEDEATIYLYGSSADKIFKSIENTLKNSSFDYVNITLQYGLAEDPNTIEKRFTL